MRKMLDTGVNVGMGVDGSASNDCGHMLAEVRQAMFLQRAHGNPGGTANSLNSAICTLQMVLCTCMATRRLT